MNLQLDSTVNMTEGFSFVKILANNFPLHKLYGFLLLNTSLVVFVPAAIVVFFNQQSKPFIMWVTFVLFFFGIVLSILFISKKRIAVQLLSMLLSVTIAVLVAMLVFAWVEMGSPGFQNMILIVSVFGFFIVEGILGLLILHSEKLSSEFDDYE